jgi:iron complex outermembrane receptor protein
MGIRAKGVLLAGCAWAVAAGAARAQTAETGTRLEEVVVTAQKRSENLQDVPIAVSAITGDVLERAHVTDLQTMNGSIPNLQIKQIGNNSLTATFTLRGVGVNEGDPYAGTAVAVVLDGVVQSTNNLALANFFDIDRVEVLRGPQGTLFGANTTGGVVNVITKQPTGVFGVDGRITAGNYKRLNAAVAVNFPIVEDRLAGKLMISHMGRNGFYTDVLTGEDKGHQNETILRGYLKFTPQADFDATLMVEYDRIRDGSSPVVNMADPGDLFYKPPIHSDIRFITTSQVPDVLRANQYAATLTANWKTGLGEFTSISNYTKYHYYSWTDHDGSTCFCLHGPKWQSHWQFTQEIRDVFHPTDNIELLLGAYGVTKNYKINLQSLLQGVIPGRRNVQLQDEDNSSLSGFAQAYWDLTDRLRLQAGLRYTHQTIEMHDTFQAYQGPGGIATTMGDELQTAISFEVRGKDSWNELGGKIGLDYKVTDDVRAYAYYARGFKTGGFNGRVSVPADIGPFDPEFVDTIEAGIKSDLFDRRARVNVAVFNNKYTNMQVPQLVFRGATATSTLLNAGEAVTRGAELDAEFLLAPGLRLTTSVGYLEAQYTKFRVGVSCPTGDVPTPSPAGCTVYDDTSMPHAPKWTASLGASYDFRVAGGDATLSGQYNYQAANWSNYTHFPKERLQAVEVVNANLRWSPTGARWSLGAWAKNLFNEKYIQTSLTLKPLWTYGVYGAPREYGVDFNFEF